MKNRSLVLLTFLFGLVLLAVLMVQYGWIQRVVALNKKAFNDAVYKSLGSVVKEVQEKENFVFIKHQIETDTLLKRTKRMLKQRSVIKQGGMKTAILSNNIQISVNSESGKETKTIVRIENDENGHRSVHNSVYVTTPSAPTVPLPASPPEPPHFSFISQDDRKENVAIILEKMLSLKDPDSVSVSPAEIEKMIATQLKQNNLPARFTFALLSKDPKKSYVKLTEYSADGWAPYKVNLYPNDIFGREITLALMLPVKETLNNFSVWGAMALSVLFTLILLALFIYSVRMLVRHKKMLAQKNDFINHMSHEFKTPLAGISLGADILIEKIGQIDPAQINRIARSIKEQSARLNMEVNDVLITAQLEENIGRPHFVFNIIAALRREALSFQLLAESKNATIEVLSDDEKMLVNGDDVLWQKVFSNLLDNALKFSNEDPHIKISAARSNGKIKIEFSDNGIGINEKDLPHIFEKFYRSNYYRQSNIKGFGLGLSFVKKVVHMHDGNISARSELGKGSTFIIEIDEAGA